MVLTQTNVSAIMKAQHKRMLVLKGARSGEKHQTDREAKELWSDASASRETDWRVGSMLPVL